MQLDGCLVLVVLLGGHQVLVKREDNCRSEQVKSS